MSGSPHVDPAANPPAVYQRFRRLNGEFKELCTRWQVRDPGSGRGGPLVLNDHLDAAYDQQILRRLAELHAATLDLLNDGAGLSLRLAGYGRRLTAALEAIRAGATHRFVAPGAESYHDIWMELHEDLLTTLGLARDEEDA